MLESLLTHYGYPILIIGTFLEGETILILAGFAAQRGYLSLDWVIICGFIGTVLGDQIYFSLGRHFGNSWLARKPSWQSRAERVFALLERHQNILIVGFRFIYGIRTVTPFAIGMSDVSYIRFTLLNLTGASVWATCIGFAGYFFGDIAEAILGNIKHYELALILAIVTVSGIVWLVYHFRHQHDS